MGKALTIVVLGLVLTGGYYSLGEKSAQYETQAHQAEDEYRILARNAALMGLDRAEQMLAEAFRTYNGITGAYEGGTYEVRATKRGSKYVVIRSTGTAQTGEGKAVTFNIRAEYERKPWPRIAKDPPSFMQYLLMAGGDLYLRGNAAGYAYTPGDSSSAPANADMHTNGSLTVEGENASAEGFGTYGVAALPGVDDVEAAFTPNDNPTESDHAYQATEVTLPTINLGDMAMKLVADSVDTGPILLTSSSQVLFLDGTREDPYVWHIEGNLIFSNTGARNFEVPGYAIILIDGKLTIEQGVQLTTPQTSYEGEDESTLAFYVGGLATLAGQTTVWGQIFAGGADILVEGQSTLYGTLVSHGDINFGGQAQYYYRGASPALTTYWQGGTNDRLERLAYSEW